MTDATDLDKVHLPGNQPTEALNPHTKADLDRELEILTECSKYFAANSPMVKAMLLRDCIPTLLAVAEEWVQASCAAKGIPFNESVSGEEWLGGPVVTMRNIRLLADTLTLAGSRVRIPLGNGTEDWSAYERVGAKVFPTGLSDKLMFAGFTATTLLRTTDVREAQTHAIESFREQTRTPGVSLILGAGNVSSIPPMDVIYKMFVEGNVCIVKMNPVNDYLTPIFEKAFAPLINAGYLCFVNGGAREGDYLAHHDLVDDVHITGSNKTHDAIVWGSTSGQQLQNRVTDTPKLKKPITSELGNVSPIIIVPGEYTDKELDALAWNVVTQLANNGSFNCNAGKLLVISKHWEQWPRLLGLITEKLTQIPNREAYYPGAKERHERFVSEGRYGAEGNVYNSRERGSVDDSNALPWTLLLDIDPADSDNIAFKEEAFCSILAQTALESSRAMPFLSEAVSFVNTQVWGTLNCCIMIDPRTEKASANILQQELVNLRYGTIGINHWPGLGYGLVSPPWGGYPLTEEEAKEDIQSGLGFVHNTYMLPWVEKTIVRGPLVVKPTPAWFVNNRRSNEIGKKLLAFEAYPSVLKFFGILWSAIRG